MTSNVFLGWRPGFASYDSHRGPAYQVARIPLYSTDRSTFSLFNYEGNGYVMAGLVSIGALVAVAIQAKRNYDEWSRNLEEQIIQEELGGWDQAFADLDEAGMDWKSSASFQASRA